MRRLRAWFLAPREYSLYRRLGAVLCGRRNTQHPSASVVDKVEVIVVGGCVKWIGPVEDEGRWAVLRDEIHVVPSAAEVVHDADSHAIYHQWNANGVISFPHPGRLVVQVASVSRSREIDAPLRNRRVDPLRDDVVLEDRFCNIADVVDDDVGAGVAQRLDVRRELRLPVAPCREVQVGSRREVVDDLKHRRPFVVRLSLLRLGRSGLPRQHRHRGRQVARRLPLRERIDAVGEHADPDARAVDAVLPACPVRSVGDVAFRRIDLARHRRLPRVRPECRLDGPGLTACDCLVGGADPLDRLELGQHLHGREGQPGPDGAVLGHAVDHGPAQGVDARQDLRRDVGPDVHRHHAARLKRDRRLPQHHAVGDRLAAPDPLGMQQLRAHLLLRRCPLRLLGHQRLELQHKRRGQFQSGIWLLLRTHRPSQQGGGSRHAD